VSTYTQSLPRCFPWVIEAPPADVRGYVDRLLDVDRHSSFAVTTDTWNGDLRLWLSDFSYQCLFGDLRHLRHASREGEESDED
jgi:hypothetical protein